MHLDQIFTNIGNFGLYQKVLSILFLLQNVVLGWQMVAIAFLGARTNFSCYIKELDNLTLDQQVKIVFDGKPSCEIYDLEYDYHLHSKNWSHSDDLYLNKTRTTCETYWIYDKSIFSDTLGSKFKLCSRDFEYWSQTLLNIGIFFGCLVIGFVSDKFGRKKAIIIFQSIWILDAILGAVAPNPILWMLSRFIMGFSSFACFDACYVLAMELTGGNGRALQAILFQIYYAVGVSSLAVVAYLVPDFTNLQIIMGVVPIPLLILDCVLLDESPRWLVSQNRGEEATDILYKIARWNKTILPSDLALETQKAEGNDKPTILDLFKTPNIRKTTLAMWLSWFSATIGYYGLTFASENLSGNIFINHALTGLVEFPAYILTYFLVQRVSRKYSTMINYCIVSMLCILFGVLGFAGFENTVMQTTIILVGKFFSSVVFALLYLNAAEVFPTALRTIGLGTSSSMARIGGVIQPQIQHLQQSIPFIQYILYGVITATGAVGTIFIPETLHRNLPETIDDAENYLLS